MANEARLHELLDLVEQARSEGDKDTEAKAIAAYKKESAPATPAATLEDRVGAVGSGFNRGTASVLGIPVDFGLNVADLAKAGAGYLQSKVTGKTPSKIFEPFNRENHVGSSEWIAKQFDKNNYTTTQMPRPDDKASQYLSAAGSALPGALMMRPTTAGQSVSATAANVAPMLAAQTAQDAAQGTEYESTAPMLSNLVAQLGVNAALRPRPQKPIDKERIKVLQESQNAGFVVPPSTTNPTVANRLLESIGGKVALQQDASAKNTNVSGDLARRALGLQPDTPVTTAETGKVRSAAGKAYEVVKKLGTINPDKQYSAALQAIANKNATAAKSFPGLANDEIGKLVKDMDQPVFDADSAVDAISVLREKSSEYYADNKKTLGKAYKQVANELEGAIERSLPPNSKLLNDFRTARREIAKTYSVDKALEGGSSVSAYKLGKQLEKGAPLEKELLTAGKFGQQFPKAAKPVLDSGSVRNTDVIVGVATAAMSKEPSLLMYPFSRMAMRDLLLSKVGQKLAVPNMPKNYVQLMSPEQKAALVAMYQQGLLAQ